MGIIFYLILDQLSKESLEVSIEERPDYTDSRKITEILNSEAP